MIKKPTSGAQKILLQVQLFTETDSFKTEVNRIRKVLEIPETGLHERIRGSEIPSESILEQRNFWSRYEKEVEELLKNLPIYNNQLSSLIKEFILYNKLNLDENSFLGDIGEITTADYELDDYSVNDDPDSSFNVNRHNKKLDEEFSKYPIVLRIHADASQNDLVEFIKANWSKISKHQDDYRDESKKASIKNSKTKQNKKARNNFIVENKKFSRKKIARLVQERFKESVDIGTIGKVLSDEAKRRKKV